MMEYESLGNLIVTLESGRWYWNSFLKLVHFVPDGKTLPTYVFALSEQNNYAEEVLRKISKYEPKRQVEQSEKRRKIRLEQSEKGRKIRQPLGDD